MHRCLEKPFTIQNRSASSLKGSSCPKSSAKYSKRLYLRWAHYTGDQDGDQKQLESTLERVNQNELNLWRAFTELGKQANMYQKLAQEYQEERQRIEFALKAIQQENRETIANLDAALEVISKIGERYGRQEPQRQREILRQVVERVVVDHRGKVRKLVLKPPFVYLHQLTGCNGGQRQVKRSNKRKAGKQTSSPNETGCSLQVSLGEPAHRSGCFRRRNASLPN